MSQKQGCESRLDVLVWSEGEGTERGQRQHVSVKTSQLRREGDGFHIHYKKDLCAAIYDEMVSS